ncbi:SusC/RagA family TonB-linked outer membrane protein [Pedobacter sp. PWIIR3]
MFFRSQLVLLFACLLFVFSAHAQRMTYQKKDVSLKQVFAALKKQTQLNVVWNAEKLDVRRVISVNFKQAAVSEVMDAIIENLPLSYVIIGSTIIVKDGEIPIKPDDTSIDSNKLLQEVEIVSTGYQDVPRQRVTGSFVQVDTTQFRRKVSPDVFSRLEGITSGLLFNKNTIASNQGNLDFSIRGRSTIYANDQPLIILDNFPFLGNFNSINPNDVASITLLKDAAAAAIWGVRAGNGVIVITTKKGVLKQPLKAQFYSNVNISSKPDFNYDQGRLSAADFIDLEKYLFANGRYDAALNDVTSYPAISPVVEILERQRNGQSAAITEQQLDVLRKNDSRNEILNYYYRNKVEQQHALSLKGGTHYSTHYFSVGYDQSSTSLQKNNNNRISLNSQNTLKLFDRLELEAGLNLIRSKATVDSAIYQIAQNVLPYYRFKNADGSPATLDLVPNSRYKALAKNMGFLDWDYRPLEELGKSPAASNNINLRLNTGIKFKVFAGLTAAIKYQYQEITDRRSRLTGLESFETRNQINRFAQLENGRVSAYPIPLGGIYYASVGKLAANNLRFQLDYERTFGKHGISAILGHEFSSVGSILNDGTKYGYHAADGSSVDVNRSTVYALNPSGSRNIGEELPERGRLDRIRSTYVNAAYTFDQKYTLSGSARVDGSNYFGLKTNQKYVPLWSAGLLWNAAQEDFYSIYWLPVLKLRASYGYNGNLDKRTTGITTFSFNGKSVLTGLDIASIGNIGNPELRWEKIGIANFGLEFGLKNNVLSGRIEYYKKNGTDILGDKAFPSTAGISVLRGNFAEMKSSGLDVLLSTQIFAGKFRWKTDLIISTSKEKVSAYDFIDSNPTLFTGATSYAPMQGRPVYGIYAYKWAGLDPQTGDPRGYLNGQPSSDYQEIAKNTTVNDLQYMGSATPTVFGGMNNMFSYGRFTLAFNLAYKLGYYFKKVGLEYGRLYDNPNQYQSQDYNKRWQKSGDEAFTDIPSRPAYGTTRARDDFYQKSAVLVAKGDHVRLQDLSLSFDVNGWKKLAIKRMQIYLYASNLGLTWKANNFGIDPDVALYSTSGFRFPEPGSIALGLKAGF